MAELNLDTSQPLNIALRYKDTMVFTINVTNSDTSPYDFTNHSALFEIRKSASDTDPVESLTDTSDITLSLGKIEINTILNSTIVPGRYSYTFQITDQNNIISTWFSGILTIKLDA